MCLFVLACTCLLKTTHSKKTSQFFIKNQKKSEDKINQLMQWAGAKHIKEAGARFLHINWVAQCWKPAQHPHTHTPQSGRHSHGGVAHEHKDNSWPL
jgi:hypothetical protein